MKTTSMIDKKELPEHPEILNQDFKFLEYKENSRLFGVGFTALFNVSRTYFLLQGGLFVILGGVITHVDPKPMRIGVDARVFSIMLVCFVGFITSIGSIHIIGKFLQYLRICIETGERIEKEFDGIFYKKVNNIWISSDPKVFNCSSVFKYSAWVFAAAWIIIAAARLFY